ncbi:MAG: hypothetical protein ACOX2Q_11705 [Dehalobacterium sp.]|jgi:hypothetical protein
MRKRCIFISTLIFAIAVILCLGNGNVAKANNELTQEQVFSQIGQFLNKNPFLLSSNENNIANKILPSYSNWDNNDVIVAEVNGWTITMDEISYRTGMNEAFGEISDANYVFNYLLEEKIKMSKAQDYGVLPTLEDVYKSIKERKKMIKENTEFNKTIDNFIKQLQISEDDYWNVYEVYNQFRVITFNNLWQVLLEEGRSNGLVAPQNATQEVITKYKYYDIDEYYFDTLLEFKDNSTVDMIQKDDFNYCIMLDKVFTFNGAGESGMSKKDISDKEKEQVINAMPEINATSNVSKSVSATTLQAVADAGWLSFPYTVSFQGLQFDEHNMQFISPIDIIIYRTTQYAPEIESRVSGFITECKALNSSGSVVYNLTGTFGNRLNWSYLTPYGLVYGKGSYGGNLGASGTYKVRVTGGLSIDNATPGVHTSSLTTSNF